MEEWCCWNIQRYLGFDHLKLEKSNLFFENNVPEKMCLITGVTDVRAARYLLGVLALRLHAYRLA